MTSRDVDLTSVPDALLERAASALRVLAHPDRLRMVDALAREDLSVGELAARVGLTPSACSQHLSQMKAHGLVSAERVARHVRYRVTDPRPLAVIGCIARHLADVAHPGAAGPTRRSPRRNARARKAGVR
ncbi:MAG: ArsR family transcriptional regulator [Phycisphaerales bacterium]|nr:MAG: ArsR family transcriptional regulator [Phycisphaerales bacterium]